MANPTTTGDLEARWRSLSSGEISTAQAFLDDAWEELISRVPSVEDRLADETLRPGLVVKVVTAMVLRVLRNPDGKASEGIDDYQYTRDRALSAGLLYASDEEVALLSPVGASTSAFTITPYFEPATTPVDEWL
jgi:hypothetical protein